MRRGPSLSPHKFSSGSGEMLELISKMRKSPTRFAYFENEFSAKFGSQKKAMGRGVYDSVLSTLCTAYVTRMARTVAVITVVLSLKGVTRSCALL